MSCDSSVETVTGLWAEHPTSLFNSQQERTVYLLFNTSSLALKLIKPPIQWVLWKFSLNVKWWRPEDTHSLLPSVEVKVSGAVPPSPICLHDAQGQLHRHISNMVCEHHHLILRSKYFRIKSDNKTRTKNVIWELPFTETKILTSSCYIVLFWNAVKPKVTSTACNEKSAFLSILFCSTHTITIRIAIMFVLNRVFIQNFQWQHFSSFWIHVNITMFENAVELCKSMQYSALTH